MSVASAMWQRDDFDYVLPEDLIAQAPPPQRSAARLLDLSRANLVDRVFTDLPDLLAPGDLLVVNNSRVIHARLCGRKESGGQVEVLIERVTAPDEVLAQLRVSKPPRPGSPLFLENALVVTVLGRVGALFKLRFPGEALTLIEAHGRLPLPPYIRRSAGEEDETRYQTLYASQPGSVAAPTAGLHFDAPLLECLAQRGVLRAEVTLHVGAGTFAPVRTQNLAAHHMHREYWHVPEQTVRQIAAAKAAGKRVIAVGTTSLRALEAAALQATSGVLRAGSGETDLFITPGYTFRCVDALVTNFHLPKSTLLMLVSAFAGYARIQTAYRHAVAAGYRFFSYGDAMFLLRAPSSDGAHGKATLS